MYNLISLIAEFGITSWEGYLLGKYFESCLDAKTERWQARLWFPVMYLVVEVIFHQWILIGNESQNSIGKICVKYAAVFLISKVFYSCKSRIHLLLTVTFFAIKENCAFLAMLIIVGGSKLFDGWVILLEKGYITSMNSFQHGLMGTACLLQVFMWFTFGVLLFFSMKETIKNEVESLEYLRKKEVFFLITPAVIGVLTCIWLRMIYITVEDDIPRILYDKYPALLFVVPVILSLSLFSIIHTRNIFFDVKRLNREKSESIILEKQIQDMQEHIKEMEHIYAGVRSIKHDMKNTLSVIMELALQKKETSESELEKYLAKLNHTMDRLEFPYKTGNQVIDILLGIKYREASRSIPEIKFQADRLFFPEQMQIQSYDLGIILGNALDNAIEACRKVGEKKKDAVVFITLSSYIRGKMLFLEVENSFDGEILLGKNSEFPVTGKANKEEHGMGMCNMKKTAEKYYGCVDWQVKGEVFSLTVMLRIE